MEDSSLSRVELNPAWDWVKVRNDQRSGGTNPFMVNVADVEKQGAKPHKMFDNALRGIFTHKVHPPEFSVLR